MINEDQEYYLAGAKHVWWKHGSDGIDFVKSVAIYVGCGLAIFALTWGFTHGLIHVITFIFPPGHPDPPKTNFVYHAPKGMETYKQYVAAHPMTGIGLPP